MFTKKKYRSIFLKYAVKNSNIPKLEIYLHNLCNITMAKHIYHCDQNIGDDSRGN
jgi:hypothetical protein